MEEITITIDQTGNTTVAVKGVKGKNCAALTKEFEESLGNVTSDSKTREFYETEPRVRVSNKG